MKILSIVFTKSKKFLPIFSWAIMLWTWKKFSHVAIKQEIKSWGKRYYQASEGKTNYEYESFFLKKHKIVEEYTIEISKEMDSLIKETCYKEAGNTYGTWQNVGIALTDIYYNVIGKKTKNPWKKGRICSEVVYVNCFKLLIPTLNYDENTIKPHHIKQIIINHFNMGEDGIWRLKS